MSASVPRSPHGPPVVLVVEDEPVLRASMVRGLARMPGIEVVDGATLAEATRLVEAYRPALIISDLSLPDGTGEALIGLLDRLRLRVPIVFVTAYLGTFQPRIPLSSDLEIHEKPVPLDRLRQIVEQRLRVATTASSEDDAPFSLVDYLQIACIGAHSVELTLELSGRPAGAVVVHKGELWSARDGSGTGEVAFRRLYARDAARHPETRTRCRGLRQPAEPRQIHTGWQVLLLESACAVDEGFADPASAAAAVEASVDEVVATLDASVELADADGDDDAHADDELPTLAPAATPTGTDRVFAERYEAGVEALLSRDFPGAFAAFLEADAAKPGDRRVAANLERLRTLGHDPATPLPEKPR
ncbi:response regulator [Myxococcota bacterium]|nr:response regulator [Myxococcota bacterium]